MSGFSEQALVQKLAGLTNTQQSIQTLSLWLLHHRKHSERVVEVWYKEVKKERKASRLCVLLYLANDVIQNARKKWPQYQGQFLHRIPSAFAHVAKYADDPTLKAMKRVVEVWRDRQVYKPQNIDTIVYAVTSNLSKSKLPLFDVSKTPPGRPSPSKSASPAEAPVKKQARISEIESPVQSMQAQSPTDVPEEAPITAASILASPKKEPDAPTTLQLLEALRVLEKPASADKDTREKIAAFPEAVASTAFLKQITNNEQAEQLYKVVQKAEMVVSDYSKQLNNEMEHRRKVQQMLKSYLDAQKLKATTQTDVLNKFRERRDALMREREEVHKHYESLPDLEKLPNTDQLPPLPTAGELFSR